MDKRPAPQKIIAKDRESLLIKLEILLSEEKMMLTTLESERDVVEHDAQHISVRQYHLEVAESKQYIKILQTRIKTLKGEKQ